LRESIHYPLTLPSQLDGGIDNVTAKVCDWFVARAQAQIAAAAATAAGNAALPVARTPGLDARSLSIGLITTGPSGRAAGAAMPAEAALAAAALVRTLVGGGGSVVLPSTSPLLFNRLFLEEALCADAAGVVAEGGAGGAIAPSIAFGQSLHLAPRSTYDAEAPPVAGVAPGGRVTPGLHIMDMPSVRDWSETVTGLAATGVQVVLALTAAQPAAAAAGSNAPTPAVVVAPGHPMVPVLHVGLVPDGAPRPARLAAATDALLTPPSDGATLEDTVTAWLRGMLALLADVAGGARRVKAADSVFFNLTRGPVGVST
jgi:hypothetical protein